MEDDVESVKVAPATGVLEEDEPRPPRVRFNRRGRLAYFAKKRAGASEDDAKKAGLSATTRRR